MFKSQIKTKVISTKAPDYYRHDIYAYYASNSFAYFTIINKDKNAYASLADLPLFGQMMATGVRYSSGGGTISVGSVVSIEKATGEDGDFVKVGHISSAGFIGYTLVPSSLLEQKTITDTVTKL